MTYPEIPGDVLFFIVQQLAMRDDQETLLSCCLVNQLFLRAARTILYATVRLSSDDQESWYQHGPNIHISEIAASPHIAPFIVNLLLRQDALGNVRTRVVIPLLTNVRTLTLEGNDACTPNSMAPNLWKTISRCLFPDLKGLTLRIAELPLQSILTEATSLQTVEILKLDRVSIASFTDPIAGPEQGRRTLALKHINVPFCPGTEELLRFLNSWGYPISSIRRVNMRVALGWEGAAPTVMLVSKLFNGLVGLSLPQLPIPSNSKTSHFIIAKTKSMQATFAGPKRPIF